MIEEMGGDFLQWLRGFFFVAKTGSVTLAARSMMRNQPTISHQIKCLENEFDVTLFDRSKGKMTLTPEGRVFLEKAVSLFEIIKEMKREINGDTLKNKGKISIATTHAVTHYFLPQFIVPFRKCYPKVEFEIEGAGLQRILEKIEAAEADFGIANLKRVPDTLRYDPLFETRLRLITHRGSHFPLGKNPTLKQISKVPFILFPGSSTITPLIEERFLKSHLELKVIMVLNNFEDVKKYVGMGVGASILDDYTLTAEDGKRFNIFPLDRFFEKREYGLILREKKYLSPPVKAFMQNIKQDAQFKRSPQ